MAYDVNRSRSVVFGGFNPSTGQGRNDFWERSSGGWSVVSITPPTETYAPVMVYDPKARLIWLFVNDVMSMKLQTYSYDGTTLRSINRNGPTLTLYGAATPGAGAGGVLLFGEFNGNAASDDTWYWNGNTWAKLAPATRPPARGGHRMSLDPERGRVVMFGGTDAAANYLTDTWEWDGTNWKDVTPKGAD